MPHCNLKCFVLQRLGSGMATNASQGRHDVKNCVNERCALQRGAVYCYCRKARDTNFLLDCAFGGGHFHLLFRLRNTTDATVHMRNVTVLGCNALRLFVTTPIQHSSKTRRGSLRHGLEPGRSPALSLLWGLLVPCCIEKEGRIQLQADLALCEDWGWVSTRSKQL